MGAIIFVGRETDAAETRVAASPETVKKLTSLGCDVTVEEGAGASSRILDSDFESAGATIVKAEDVKKADVVLRVRRPSADDARMMKSGAILLTQMDPYGNEEALKPFAEAGVTAFAMELMPRITRAQSMDVLSSQANLAGYQAVIEAALHDRQG